MQGGKAAPAEWHLDRVRCLSDSFVVAWRAPEEELRGAWVLFEQSGDPLWREAGIERRERYAANQDALSAGIALAIWAQCEGLHWWGEWGDGVAFTEHMYESVQQGLREQENQVWRQKVAASIRAQEAADLWEEGRANPGFIERLKLKHPELASFVEAFSQDEFKRICRGRTLASVAGARLAPTEGAA